MNTKTIIIAWCFMLFANCSFGQYSSFKYQRKNHSSVDWYEQSTEDSKYFTIGGGPVLSTYFGDVTPKEKFFVNALKVTRPGFSAFVNYNWKAPFSFSGDLFYSRIIGDDFNNSPEEGSPRKYVRNLSFRNDLIGFTARGNFMILNDKFEYFKRLDFNIYLNAGVSVYYSNPKAKIPYDSIFYTYAGDWVPLRPLGTEGQNNPATGVKKYSSVQVGIPIGLGMRFRLGYKTDLYIDASLTYMLSDYIDDIGEKYVDLGALESGVAKLMSDRSIENTSSLKNEPRDWDLINDYTESYSYVSVYDGKTYDVFKGFGEDGAMRGGETNEFISLLSFRISYIISN